MRMEPLAIGCSAISVDSKRYLPESLVEGCRLKRSIEKDAVLSYDDIELPKGRLADKLRAEQYRVFRKETWLEEVVKNANA